MANVDSPTLTTQVPRTGSHGNGFRIFEAITPIATVNIADVVRVMLIPAYFRLDDLTLFTNAANASATIKVGYATVDGTTDVDDDYFILAATSIATASRIRATGTLAPKYLTQDAYLTITVAGATVSTSTTISVVLEGEYIGYP